MDRPIPGEAGIASDAEIRSELAEFRDHLDGIDPRKGARAYVGKDGRAVLPKGAPRASSRRRTRRHQALQVGRWARRVEGLGPRLLGLRVVRAGGRAATREPARLEWPEALRRWGAGRWNHHPLEPRPRLRDRRRTALRYEWAGLRRHALAAALALDRRLHRPPPAGALRPVAPLLEDGAARRPRRNFGLARRLGCPNAAFRERRFADARWPFEPPQRAAVAAHPGAKESR